MRKSSKFEKLCDSELRWIEQITSLYESAGLAPHVIRRLDCQLGHYMLRMFLLPFAFALSSDDDDDERQCLGPLTKTADMTDFDEPGDDEVLVRSN